MACSRWRITGTINMTRLLGVPVDFAVTTHSLPRPSCGMIWSPRGSVP